MSATVTRSTTRNQKQPTSAAAAPANRRPAGPVPQSKPAITQDDIAHRARQIWQSGKGGTDLENWLQAEKELRTAPPIQR